jgi:hypothetical protein
MYMHHGFPFFKLLVSITRVKVRVSFVMQGALSFYASTIGNEVKSAHFVWSYIYAGSQKQEISKRF